jgi:hypothetical protein
MLADAIKYVITSQHTELSGVARPVQTRKMRKMGTPKTIELCIGRQPIEHFQPIDEHPSVIIGCNPRRLPEAVRTVATGSRSQNPQNVPPGDAVTKLSPLSLPQMSSKTSEKEGGEVGRRRPNL